MGGPAHGPGDCRTDRHRVPTDGKRLSVTKSTRNWAAGQLGSRRRSAKPQDDNIRWDKRVTCGSQAARVPGEQVCENIRRSGYRSPVAGGEEVAGVLRCQWYPFVVSKFPSGVSGLWHPPAMALGHMLGYMTLKKKKKNYYHANLAKWT